MSDSPVMIYPLSWPEGWPRISNYKVRKSRYGDHTLAQAKKAIINEAGLLGGKNIIISTNIPVRADGFPMANRRTPEDRAAAVYFDYNGKKMCFACDSWNKVEDNLWAINLTIVAIRQIERAGASELLERAFRGFAALPAPGNDQWWDVLKVPRNANSNEIKSAYFKLAKENHPDGGGTTEKFLVIRNAYTAALEEIRNKNRV